MQITVDFPDDVFASPKPPAQMVQEIRQAVAMYWLARGEISPEKAQAIARPAGLPDGRDLREILLAMPDAGEDEDFERPVDHGREDTSPRVNRHPGTREPTPSRSFHDRPQGVNGHVPQGEPTPRHT